MAAALCCGSHGGGAQPALHHQAAPYDTDTLIGALEPLPGYAPELNPVEGLGASLKGVELANLADDTLEEVTAMAERGIRGIPHLPYSFLRHCGLSLWQEVVSLLLSG
jgi:transposase